MNFLQKLQIFSAVAEHQSFAKAAAALRLTRPSITIAINELEKEIGVRLLHRTTRRTTLTSEGSAYHEQVLLTLSSVADAKTFFGADASEPSGRLRVDMSNSIARSTVIPRIAQFQRLYPKVEIVLGVSDLHVDLIAEGVDCVLRVGSVDNTSMVSRRIAEMSMVTCAAPAYLLEHGTPTSLDDLEHHLAVAYFQGRNGKQKDWQFIVDGEPRSIRMRHALQVNDHDAYVSCAVHGLGLAQVPVIGIAQQLASGQLVPILQHLDAGTMPLSFIYPARQHLPAKVRAFLDWIISVFAGVTAPQTRIAG